MWGVQETMEVAHWAYLEGPGVAVSKIPNFLPQGLTQPGLGMGVCANHQWPKSLKVPREMQSIPAFFLTLSLYLSQYLHYHPSTVPSRGLSFLIFASSDKTGPDVSHRTWPPSPHQSLRHLALSISNGKKKWTVRNVLWGEMMAGCIPGARGSVMRISHLGNQL